ncbi:MAG: hypothetical protein K9H16_06640 [Bacteroidales bacterium]|nr:hypothetical protein [Bacteroidales bacterium]
MEELVLKYNLLDKNAKQQLNDFLDFLLMKAKNSPVNQLEYTQKIQTVSQWSEDDVAYLKDISDNYNWNVEEW